LIKLFSHNYDRKVFDELAKFQNDNWVNADLINRFEKKLAKYLSLENKLVSTCNSGTDALKIIFSLIKDNKKNIFITSPYSYISSASSLKSAGYEIIYIDINENNFNIDVDKLENFLINSNKSIVKKIAGVLNIEIFGGTNNLQKLKKLCSKYNIFLIGDCAQSIGTKYNNKSTLSYYDFASISFYPTKIYSTYGDGGAIISKKKYKKDIEFLKNNGHSVKNKEIHRFLGFNSRLDTIHAIILSYKLKKLNQIINSRKKNFNIYKKKLDSNYILPKYESNINWNSYILNIRCKIPSSKVNKYLKNCNIETKTIYNKLLSEYKLLKPIFKTPLDKAKKLTKNTIALPINENLQKEEIMHIINKLNSFNK
jgi:dTDP-4-amino-4,6-dideoxygalactose transaminase